MSSESTAETAGFYSDGLTEAAIDALLEQVDRDLAADEHAAQTAFRFDFNDQRRVSRSRRRAGRELLRSHFLIAGSPGQRKGVSAILFDGEAA